MSEEKQNKRRQRRKVKKLTEPTQSINKFVGVSGGHILAKKLIDESGYSMEEIANCVGVTRKMLYVGLSDDRYPWIVEAILGCLGYESELGYNIKTPKGEANK